MPDYTYYDMQIEKKKECDTISDSLFVIAMHAKTRDALFLCKEVLVPGIFVLSSHS